MKKKNILKLLLVFVLLLGFSGFINVFSKTLVDYYDDMFKTNNFTVYTEDQITDDATFYQSVSNVIQHYSNQEYWNSVEDYSSLRLLVQNCNYDKMTCDFRLERNKYSDSRYTVEDVKVYSAIKVEIESDLDEYFTMIEDNKVKINYDESMFATESDKSNYILDYFNSLSSYQDGTSVSYSFDQASNVITRTECYNLIVTRVMSRKIEGFVFEYTEGEYSDTFKKLTSGTLTIKSDAAITKDMLQNYINSFWLTNGGFTLDGDIIGNKVFIKRMEYQDNGPSKEVEKHLVTLVQDSNINMDLFKKIGAETAMNIPTEKPENKLNDYLINYFNQFSYSFELDDGGYERYNELYVWDQWDYIVIKYEKVDSENKFLDVQFHRVPIVFAGYSDVVTDTYKKKVGDEVVVAADSLSIETINSHFNYNPVALGCNDDFSYCDIGLFDHTNNNFEIHNVKITLNNIITDAFKKAFNIKADGTFDIIVGKGVYVQYFNPYIYVESTQESLNFDCGTVNGTGSDNKCNLTLKNYSKNLSETHTIEYNILEQNVSTTFDSLINSEINVYPGESSHLWGNLPGTPDYFTKKKLNSNNFAIGQCSVLDKTCPVIMINSDNVLEVHNTKVNINEGQSPEFKKAFKDDTLKINSIYKDDDNYLFKASMGYLMSKTKSWSYLDNITENTGRVVYNNIEAHSMNIEFAESNEEHKLIVDAMVDKIGNKPIEVEINDLEFINDFYYRGGKVDLTAPNYNSKMLNDVLGKIIDNKHISYFLAVEGGLSGPFIQAYAGQVVLYYDGIAYATTKSYVETMFKNIVYIPNNTENTREAYVAAVQKRIDDYLGKNSGVVVSFSRTLDEGEIDSYYFDVDTLDGDVYRLTYKDKETEFLIIKDSSKMQTSTFNAVDVNNNVSVSSKNANYPTNTIVSSDKLTEEESKELLEKLKLKDAEVVDINLYSPTIGDIDNFSNVEFSVNVPIDTEELGSENLYAYYIDDNGKIEEYPVVVDDFMASFETNHFSTYVIGKKVDENIINPNTYDGILSNIILLCLSIIVLCGCIYYFKRENKI